MGTLQSRPFCIKTIITYNRFDKKFQETFLDSEHRVLVDYDGEKSGDTLTFEKNWVYPDKGMVRLRVVYIFISADEFRVETMRMPENTTAWDTVQRMKYMRGK